MKIEKPLPLTIMATAKSIGVVYQNSNRMRIVTVSITCTITGAGQQAFVFSSTKATSPPGLSNISVCGIISTNITSMQITITHTFIVPPNWYYKITDGSTGGGAAITQIWSETNL